MVGLEIKCNDLGPVDDMSLDTERMEFFPSVSADAGKMCSGRNVSRRTEVKTTFSRNTGFT